MSWVTGEPEMISTASGNMAGVNAMMATQNAAAAVPTTGVLPPAADLVSNVVAAQFAIQAQHYQQLATLAQELHNQMVATLQGNASAYTNAEIANAVTAH